MSAENLNWITSVPIGMSIGLIGLFLNILSIATWSNICRNPPTRKTGITALSFIILGVVDTVTLCFFIASDSVKAAFPWLIQTYAYAWFYSYIGFPLNFFCIVSSIWIIVHLTYDRFTLITQHTERKHGQIIRRSLLLLAIIFIFNLPHFFNYHPVMSVTNGTHGENKGREYYTYRATEYGQSRACFQYEFWFHCMGAVIIPILLVTVLNALLLREILITSHFVLKKMSVSSISSSIYEFDGSTVNIVQMNPNAEMKRIQNDQSITKTLLGLTFTFIILLTFQCVCQCLWMLHFNGDADARVWETVNSFYAFARLSVVVHCVINCLLYCFTGTLFRRELFKLFGLRKPLPSIPLPC
uniref:Putative Gprotein coupled receptor 139like [Hydra vulgaris] n=1 Tax=Lepeophtheirus salmonis TaxID=72036 RepID=A0A0K2U7C5_LEPSM